MKIPIVNEQDEVVGLEERPVVHQQGLLHREVYVWFVTSNKEIFFQKRSITQETYPGLLASTVGGHVLEGENYLNAAVREVFADTGLKVVNSDLVFIKKIKINELDLITNLKDYTFVDVYAFPYKGQIEKLKKEVGSVDAFVSFSLEKLYNLSTLEKELFIPYLLEDKELTLFKEIISKV